jgi:hypothetical protein
LSADVVPVSFWSARRSLGPRLASGSTVGAAALAGAVSAPAAAGFCGSEQPEARARAMQTIPRVRQDRFMPFLRPGYAPGSRRLRVEEHLDLTRFLRALNARCFSYMSTLATLIEVIHEVRWAG